MTGEGGGFCCTTTLCVPVPDCTPACDLDGDGIVSVGDFLVLLPAWGSCGNCDASPADFDGDCTVEIADLLTAAGALGLSAIVLRHRTARPDRRVVA